MLSRLQEIAVSPSQGHLPRGDLWATRKKATDRCRLDGKNRAIEEGLSLERWPFRHGKMLVMGRTFTPLDLAANYLKHRRSTRHRILARDHVMDGVRLAELDY
jgi:hypothetical protein